MSERRNGGRRASIARAVPAPAAGLARILGAAAADVAHAVDPRRRPAVDPLDLRDPEYIRRTLPAVRAMANLYFRVMVLDLPGRVPTRRTTSSRAAAG